MQPKILCVQSMDPKQLHKKHGLDERLVSARCAYCGNVSDTVDHVPSKVFLDDPLPENLPVVPACTACNRGFSLDEEYLACFLASVLAGTAKPEAITRPKIQRALRHSPKLAQHISASCQKDTDGRLIWVPDANRVTNIVLKLARGHVLYESSTAQLEPPQSVLYLPLLAMSTADREDFEVAGYDGLHGWPEIGSRAFLRAVGVSPYSNQDSPWIEVQKGQIS